MNFFILKFKKGNEINLLTNAVVTEVNQNFVIFSNNIFLSQKKPTHFLLDVKASK